MNYPPSYHLETDRDRLVAAIEAIRHATLLVPGQDGPLVSFTPFFFGAGHRVLYGHIAAHNPQAGHLPDARVDAIFHGPHVYVSPRLNDNDDVPTWNYVNVHVTGKARVIDDNERKWQLMQTFVDTMEGDNAEAYIASHGSRLKPMVRAIVMFEIEIEKLVGRFKLGRNDATELQRKTFAALMEDSPASMRQWLATLAPVD